MADSYSVKAQLSAVDNGFSSTLKNAIGATDTLGSKLKGFSFGLLTGAGQAAFNTIKNSISGVISTMNDSNAAWKTFSSNMSMLGKSSGEIDAVKKDLQAFAEQTVYSASDMAGTYSQLAAVGVKNCDKLVKGFGGLAAASENPTQAMKTLSTQATQMAAKPKVAWADFKLMLEQTPAGIAAVAKQMGMTTSELVTAVQEGTVSTEEFFDAISAVGTNKAFTKLATEYKTVGQAMDGLTETVSNKLAPAFDVLSNIGIKAVSGIADWIGKLDGEAIAGKVSGWVKKAMPYWNSFKKAVSTVGQVVIGIAKKVGPIFKAFGSKIASTVKKILDKIGSIDAGKVVDSFSAALDKAKPYMTAIKSVVSGIASAISKALPYVIKFGQKIVDFFLDHADTISKCIPYLAGLVGAYKGFKIVKALAPGMASFASSLASMAAKGVKGLAAKLFGVAAGQTASGEAAAVASKQLIASGKAFLMIGIGILAISAGFALLAQSAIALAAAGWPAVAVMLALVLAVAALSLGMMAMMKTITASPAQLTGMAVALLALGAAVLMVGIGFALMAQAAIALSNAGWGAIAMFIALIAVVALFAVGAALLGTALTAGAIGFIAFGAAILLCGAGAILAAVGLQMVAAVLPALCQYGLEGAVAILALGAALLVFGAGALVAGAGALVLGAGLLVVGAAVMLVATGFMILATAIILAGVGLTMISAVLPVLAEHGSAASGALIELGLALLVFGAGALVGGAGALVLGAGLLVVGAAVMLIATGFMLLATATILAAVGLTMIAAVLPVLAANGEQGADALILLGDAFIEFGAGALVAGAGALVLAAGLLALGVALVVVAAGLLATGVGGAVAAGGIALLNLVLPQLVAQSAESSAALIELGAALLVFGAGALVAGAGAIVLGAGMLGAAVGIMAAAVAVTLLGTGMMMIGVGALIAAASMTILAQMLPLVAQMGAESALSLLIMAAAMTVFGAGALVAGAGALVFGAGLLVVGAAILLVDAGLLLLVATCALLGATLLLTAAGLTLIAGMCPLVSAATMLLMASFASLTGISAAVSAAILLISVSILAAMASALAGAVGIVAFGAALLVASVGALTMAAAMLIVASSVSSIAKDAKKAEKSLINMQDAVSIVEAGLKGLGDMAEGAMDLLGQAFKSAAADAKKEAKNLAKGFTDSLKSGLALTPAVALLATMAVVTAFRAGYSGAYSAGAYISQGFALGMKSQLSSIKSAAAAMAAAAEAAVRAKAKIHSPSKVFGKLGTYTGQGYVNELAAMVKEAWKVAKDLVTIPSVQTPDFAMAYAGELSSDYSYSASREYTIEVPLSVDGKEFAKATASYTQDELEKRNVREDRKHGRL